VDRLLDLWRSKVLRLSLAAVVLIAGVAVVIEVTKAAPTYPINVVYASAPGLFPGAAVDVLGVPVGTVTSVKNFDDEVEVGLRVRDTTKIPSLAVASLVAPEVLGQPDVDLNPGYTGGPHLSPGATIPESRTSVPVSTDQFLKELQRTLNELNPNGVSDLITNLAEDLDGQGAGLNQLIASAAGTIQLLAEKGDDLGQLNGTLAQLTGTLDSDTSQIEQLVQEYDTVSTVIAQHSGQLNDALTQLTGATTSLVTLLTPNLQPLEADVGVVTTASRTLDRNVGTVDEILQQTNNLFQGAERAVDTNYDWLDLNSALPPGVTGAVETDYVIDSLAGICRRIGANFPNLANTLPAGQLQGCETPGSSFYTPITDQVTTILNSLSRSPSASASAVTPNSLLQQGLQKIEGISGANTTPKGGATGGSSSTSSSTTTTEPAPTTTTTTTPCGLLGSILGCGKGAGSSGGSGGGLLSQEINPDRSQQVPVQLATNVQAAPSLTAPAARLLPPLPGAPQARHIHRGLLAQWAHDVRSWF
jgi:phospholipid/cholesterol/gamma-HCH transport system substrate-binding protein